MDLINVADLLVAKIRKDYKDDIAIVALCGSYIYGDTHKKSDLDFYFIPRTKRGYEMSQCFILEDIGFDFWGMSWNRAESLAKYNETNTSIISKAQVIYHSSKEDLDRFNSLRNVGESISKEEFLRKATEQAEVCQNYYFKMLEAGNRFSWVKQNAICVLYYSAFSIALLNHGYVERGGRNLLNEIMAMRLYPSNYQELYEKIICSNHIDELVISSQEVIMSLRNLIQSQQETHKTSISPGYYEEIKSIYNKLLHACETDNQQGMMLAIARLDNDVSQLMSEAGHSYSQFPDLFSDSKERDNSALVHAIQAHEAMFLEILREQKVPVICYQNIGEFRAHLNM